MKNLTIALAGLLLCGACTTETTGGTGITTSYIKEYRDIEDISVEERHRFSIDEEKRIIAPHGASESLSDYSGIALELRILGKGITERSERYETLCKETGDMHFNRKLSALTFWHRPDALTKMTGNLHITVNEDYSADYPAGADASGLFTLFYENPYAVVLNNYQSPPNTYRLEYTSIDLPQAVYKVPLAEADLKGKKALGVQFYLLLNSAPDRSGSYTFTIGVEATDGDALKITTKPISIQAEP